MVYYDVGPVAPCNRSIGSAESGRRGSRDTIDDYNYGENEDGKFEMSWENFQEALLELRGRMTKHGGFYNVASTYFLLTYSGHGFKHWFLPMGFLRKGFWIFLVLFFVYCMIDQSVQTVQNYLSYPKSVSVYVSE
jgi:hypothetical protein